MTANKGWIFLWANTFLYADWESSFPHVVKVQVPNPGGASRQKPYCAKRNHGWKKMNSILSSQVCLDPGCSWSGVPKYLPHCLLWWVFAIPSSWSCPWGGGSRSRSIAKTGETLKPPSKTRPVTHLFYQGSWQALSPFIEPCANGRQLAISQWLLSWGRWRDKWKQHHSPHRKVTACDSCVF